jgi:hypothetical protein
MTLTKDAHLMFKIPYVPILYPFLIVGSSLSPIPKINNYSRLND